MKRNDHERDLRRFIDGLGASNGIPHSISRIDRISSSGDASGSPYHHWRWKYEVLPDVVVWPRSVDEVVSIVDLARQHAIPLTPRGGGTCYAGSAVPTRGGILLDMKRLDGMTLRAENRQVIVQAGATFANVNASLRDHGLVLQAWPTSAAGATIGGWISTGGHVGFGTARHGGFKEQVVEVEVVHASGRVERITKPARIEDFFGSCGTLGVIVSATINVVPVGQVSARAYSFRSWSDLGASIFALLSRDPKPAFIRFSDRPNTWLSRGSHDPSWTLLVIDSDQAKHQEDLAVEHGGTFLGADASRRLGDGILVHETLPKKDVPVLMIQQFLLSLRGCFHLIDAGRHLAGDLGLPLGCTATVGSAERVRVVLESPTDNGTWTRFMATKAMLHELTKIVYNKSFGRVYASGMLDAMYVVKFERDAVARWIHRKYKVDPAGILNPFKHASSKMSYLRVDVLFSINLVLQRLRVRLMQRGPNRESDAWAGGGTDSPLKRCAHCEACRDACPVYRVTGHEAADASGRHRAISTYDKEAFAPDRELSTVLLSCTTCGACKTSCPVGIDHPAFVVERRTRLARDGVFTNERHVYMRDAYVGSGNVYGEDRARRADWMRGEMSSQFHVVDLGEVAYFTGCTAAFRFRETAVNTLLLLSRIVPNGIVVLGDEEECCGGPLIRVGQGEIAGVVARVRGMVQNLTRRGVKRVVFSCPGCYSTALEYWPKMLGAPLPFEVLHVVELVASLVQCGHIRFKPGHTTLTYHDPCHLGRELGIFDAPRQAITAIPGTRLIEMARSREQAACCGAGGGVRSALPDVASRIAEGRIEEARKTGADTLVTACVFCVQALRGAIEAARVPMKCIDIVELLSSSIDVTNTGRHGGVEP